MSELLKSLFSVELKEEGPNSEVEIELPEVEITVAPNPEVEEVEFEISVMEAVVSPSLFWLAVTAVSNTATQKSYINPWEFLELGNYRFHSWFQYHSFSWANINCLISPYCSPIML